MHKKTRPVFAVGRELDAIGNLAAHLEGWAQLVRTVTRSLWAWDDPKGELFGEKDHREMLYRIQRLAESPRLYPLTKL